MGAISRLPLHGSIFQIKQMPESTHFPETCPTVLEGGSLAVGILESAADQVAKPTLEHAGAAYATFLNARYTSVGYAYFVQRTHMRQDV